MKRRFLMVSAMILLLGSQVDMFAQQKKGGPDFKKPGMEMREGKKSCKLQDKKFIKQEDIKRLQNLYWEKYRVRLSKSEAEKILMAEMRDGRDFDRRPGPGPKGPQMPSRK